ncbi:MAG: TRAP transporter small permease subunit [Candidatus Marinimicrobia bacterium]|nr:TRAP transporter small permease subunit [Candidatus Neomarinimicrobiota bacterium]
MVHKLRIIIEKFAGGLAVFLMLALVILSFTQVVLRNFFSIGFSAVEELMRNGVLWIAFVGATLTTLRGKHISIDILPRILKNKNKHILEWFLTIIASIICLIMMWYGTKFIILEIEMDSVIAGICPAWIIEIIIPFGFLLLALSFPLRLLDTKHDGAD